MAEARWTDSVTPLADPTTAPQTGPNPFKVTILISHFSKLILINYINYHKPLCLSKSQSDRYLGAIGACVDGTCCIRTGSLHFHHMCHFVIVLYAPELHKNAGLPFQHPALSLLFSLHIFSLRGCISMHGYVTAIAAVLKFLSPSEPLFQVPDTYSNYLLDHLHGEGNLEKTEKCQEVGT